MTAHAEYALKLFVASLFRFLTSVLAVFILSQLLLKIILYYYFIAFICTETVTSTTLKRSYFNSTL